LRRRRRWWPPANWCPNAALTYLFADGPSDDGRPLGLAQYAESFIEGPSQMIVLGEAPLAVEGTSASTVACSRA
jgi:hypothetical protein